MIRPKFFRGNAQRKGRLLIRSSCCDVIGPLGISSPETATILASKIFGEANDVKGKRCAFTTYRLGVIDKLEVNFCNSPVPPAPF